MKKIVFKMDSVLMDFVNIWNFEFPSNLNVRYNRIEKINTKTRTLKSTRMLLRFFTMCTLHFMPLRLLLIETTKLYKIYRFDCRILSQ